MEMNLVPKKCPFFKSDCLETDCALWVERIDLTSENDPDHRGIAVKDCAISMAAIGMIKPYQIWREGDETFTEND